MGKNKPKGVRVTEILSAAEKCFFVKGLQNTTIDDIAVEAGLTKGGIYWHFKNKRELYISLVERHLKEDILAWRKLISNKKMGKEKIADAGIAYLKYYTNNKGHLYLHAELFAGTFKDEALREKLGEIHNKWQKIIAEILKEIVIGKNYKRASEFAEDISILILSCIEGMAHQYWLTGNDEDFVKYEKTWNTFTHILTEGIKNILKIEI